MRWVTGSTPFTANAAAEGVPEANGKQDGEREHQSEHDEAGDGLFQVHDVGDHDGEANSERGSAAVMAR